MENLGSEGNEWADEKRDDETKWKVEWIETLMEALKNNSNPI